VQLLVTRSFRMNKLYDWCNLYWLFNRLIALRFHVRLDTKYVILEMLFTASPLAITEKACMLNYFSSSCCHYFMIFVTEYYIFYVLCVNGRHKRQVIMKCLKELWSVWCEVWHCMQQRQGHCRKWMFDGWRLLKCGYGKERKKYLGE